MTGVYKITNKLNNKCYIGISFDIEKRWKDHIKYAFKECDDSYHKNRLYNALRKYGLKNFTFEVIEECNKDILKEREVYWISHYNSYNYGYNLTLGGDISGYNVEGTNHPNVKLSEDDVKDIRTRYNNLERKMEVYELYKHKINRTGFNKVWQGCTWKHIMMDVYTEENKKYHKLHTNMIGTKNGRSKLNENDIKNILLLKKEGNNFKSVYNQYSNVITEGYFKNIWYRGTWKHILEE